MSLGGETAADRGFSGLPDPELEGRYRYWRGFNPATVLATVAAAAFYLWTLNPYTWTSSNGLSPYITAGIPSFFVAFVVYAVVMRLWVLPWLDSRTPVEAADRTKVDQGGQA